MNTSVWQSKRPDEPQVPLYAAYSDIDKLQGVLFAQVRTGKLCFVGRVADARGQLYPSLNGGSGLVKNPYSDAVRDEWAEALRALADEFIRGEASVAPKAYPETCKYCSLPSLCRVAETVVALSTADCEEPDATGESND
jgi:ATP-dependent helicase/nuclease subunit B